MCRFTGARRGTAQDVVETGGRTPDPWGSVEGYRRYLDGAPYGTRLRFARTYVINRAS